METYTEKVGNQLNNLLEKNYDAEKGFTKAAENVENKNLESYFKHKASERYNFGHELKSEIKAFGENVEKGGSTTGAMHRTWMDVKSLLSLSNEEAMLEEAIRGEKTAVEEYERVLEETSLPLSTKQILQKQKNTIESELTTIKTLEDLNVF